MKIERFERNHVPVAKSNTMLKFSVTGLSRKQNFIWHYRGIRNRVLYNDRFCGVKRIECSNGLDTMLYKNYLYRWFSLPWAILLGAFHVEFKTAQNNLKPNICNYSVTMVTLKGITYYFTCDLLSVFSYKEDKLQIWSISYESF